MEVDSAKAEQVILPPLAASKHTDAQKLRPISNCAAYVEEETC
jgi:hypothetical protein